MPLAGKGMLITSMDVDAADEDDFNLWYDREHLAERVALDGFLEARRWIAVEASPKYFCTYSTVAFEDLDSPAYAKALANQTEWSRRNIARFRNMGRVVGANHREPGAGTRCGARGRAAASRRPLTATRLRATLRELLDPGRLPGIISLHLIESDPRLSGSLDAAGPAEARRRRLVRADRRHRCAGRAGADRHAFQGARGAGRLDRLLSPAVGPEQERPLGCRYHDVRQPADN